MANPRGPRHRMCRRVGEPLCGSPRCPSLRRPYPPGQHGQAARPRRESQYAVQLREKQKLRFIYGVGERQFRRYFRRALGAQGRPGERLLQLLECRLDNVVYRLGLARTRPQARQLIVHGHIQLNGRKATIPSITVVPGDEVAVRPESRNLDPVQAALAQPPELPPYLEADGEGRGRLLHIPNREEIPVPVDEHLVVEFYSR